MTIDAATLAELKALDDSGSGGLLDELIGLFESGTPERVSKMREAAGKGDALTIERESHALKGSCGALGATSLLKMASELELRGKASNLAEIGERLDAIEAEFTIALGELRAEQRRK